MQLGMPILIELPDLEANAKLALELGLDFMELSMCLPAYQSEMLHGEVFKRMHLSKGTYFTLPDRKEFLYQNHYGDYLISVQEFRSFIEDVIGVENAVLCIENTDGFSSFQQDAIESLLRSPVFALTYDIGHDHSNEYQDRDFMFSHRARIRHMHIHNAIGKRNHLALGEGDIDLREIISFIQSQEASSIPMSVVVETKTVNALRNSIPLLSDSCLARI